MFGNPGFDIFAFHCEFDMFVFRCSGVVLEAKCVDGEQQFSSEPLSASKRDLIDSLRCSSWPKRGQTVVPSARVGVLVDGRAGSDGDGSSDQSSCDVPLVVASLAA